MPVMVDSIQEQILKLMAGALGQITVQNGYGNTIAAVQRHRASGIDLSKLPTILVREGDCAVELPKSSHERVRRRLEVFVVVATGLDEETDTRSGSELLNSLIADIEATLGDNEKWNGLALMTEPPEYITIDVDAETPHLARGMR